MTFRRRALLYVPILLGASALLLLRTFLYARVLPVERFGLLNQAMLFATTFTSFAGAGFQLLGHKLLPQYHARGDRQSFDELVSACIALCAVAALIVALVLSVSMLLGWVNTGPTFAVALLYAISQYLFLLRLIEIKSELKFMAHARLSAGRALALTSVGVTVAVLTRNVPATLAAEGLATLAAAAPLFMGERGKSLLRKIAGLRTDHRWLAENYPAALRLLWLNGTSTLLYSIDRWAGIALLTKREYGIFALGVTIISLFETLQVIVNVSAYPLMGRMVARGERGRAFRFASLATLVVLVVGGVCYVPFVLFLDVLLRNYLPAYVDAGLVIELAVMVGLLRLADFYASFSVLVDRERRLALLSGAMLAIFIVVLATMYMLGVVFDPARMMLISLGIAAGVFALNLTVAMNARRSGPPPARTYSPH